MWFEILFAVIISVCALLYIIVFIEWNIYRAFEYKRFKLHLKSIEEIHREKEKKDE